MMRSFGWRLALLALLGCTSGLVHRGLVWSQEDRPSARKAASAAADQGEEKPKSRGRLPMFYSRVVDAEQREKIYAIQAKYEKEISALQAELRDLEQQRDDEVFGVLTKGQQKQITDMVEDLKKRREALRSSGAEPASDDPAQDP